MGPPRRDLYQRLCLRLGVWDYVHNHIGTLHIEGRTERLPVVPRRMHRRDRPWELGGRLPPMENGDLVSGCHETPRHVSSNKASAPDNENGHFRVEPCSQ